MATVRVKGGRVNVEGGDGISPERRRDLELAALAMLGERSGLASEQLSALEERPPSKPVKLGPLPKKRRREPSQLRRSSEWRQGGVSDEVLESYSKSTPGHSIN